MRHRQSRLGGYRIAVWSDVDGVAVAFDHEPACRHESRVCGNASTKPARVPHRLAALHSHGQVGADQRPLDFRRNCALQRRRSCATREERSASTKKQQAPQHDPHVKRSNPPHAVTILAGAERKRRSARIRRPSERPFPALCIHSGLARQHSWGGGAKVGQKSRPPALYKEAKGPVSGAFRVAGAGFEPATSGL
jgi:hypothetical protein